MQKKIVFIHTVTGVIDLFRGLAAELTPGAKLCHVADETLIQSVLAAGGVTPWIRRRVCDHVVAAAEAGADVIQVTCSSISPCVDVARPLVDVPVLKIDDAVAGDCVARFGHIGVIATAPTALQPVSDLLRTKAAAAGRDVRVTSVFCDGAYDAMFAGDLARHDEIVRARLTELRRQVDAVLLAQVSMVRAADSLAPEAGAAPILSAPRPAMLHLAKLLGGAGDSAR